MRALCSKSLGPYRVVHHRGRLHVAFGVVVVKTRHGINTFDGTVCFRGKQDVVFRYDAEQQVNTRLVVDTGVKKHVVQQLLYRWPSQLLGQAPVTSPVVRHRTAAVRNHKAQRRKIHEQIALNELHERRGVRIQIVRPCVVKVGIA